MAICPVCGSTESKHWITCRKYPEEKGEPFKSKLICMSHCNECEDHPKQYDIQWCSYRTEEEKRLEIKYTKCQMCGERFPEGYNFCPCCGTKQVQDCKCWMKNGESFDCKQRICPGHKLPILLSKDASLKGEKSNV